MDFDKFAYLDFQLDEPDNLLKYLEIEELVARADFKENGVFFIWQVPPTVIYGRNQIEEAEVDVKYCRENGIRVCQRKSGGGCVYADEGNIMISLIVNEHDVQRAFNQYISALVAAMNSLGLDAEASGRNDVVIRIPLVEGVSKFDSEGGADGNFNENADSVANGLVEVRKISGNACYAVGGRCIVHGTLLWDVDVEHMVRAITPSKSKLDRKGVQSVRQRVTNLKKLIELSDLAENCGVKDMESLKKYLRSFFTDRQISFEELN